MMCFVSVYGVFRCCANVSRRARVRYEHFLYYERKLQKDSILTVFKMKYCNLVKQNDTVFFLQGGGSGTF